MCSPLPSNISTVSKSLIPLLILGDKKISPLPVIVDSVGIPKCLRSIYFSLIIYVKGGVYCVPGFILLARRGIYNVSLTMLLGGGGCPEGWSKQGDTSYLPTEIPPLITQRKTISTLVKLL